jgi:hypothetical protein
MGAINNLTNSYLQSIIDSTLQKPGVQTDAPGSANGASATLLQSQPDNSGLSPLGQLLSTLQQLQQSNPTQYQQVTQQIATNLQDAAQTAQKDGNTTAANQLSQLATDFTNASQNNQLPNIQDLAKALGGGHHHHHSHAASSDPNSDSSSTDSSTGTTSSTSSSSTLAQILAAFQTNGSQNEALSPLAIITNTLSSAGIGTSNG